MEANFSERGRGRYRDESEGKRVRAHSYGGEGRKRRVSFADESEEEEALRLLQTGVSSYARHNSTHYSSKEILLTPPSSRRDIGSRREEHTEETEGVLSINGRKVEKTNMRLKPVHFDVGDAVSFTKESNVLPKLINNLSCTNEHLQITPANNIAAKMVVNSRRQYKVLLPTGNPNITISVRSGDEKDNNKEEDITNDNENDEAANFPNRKNFRLTRRSLQEPLNDSYIRNSLRDIASHGYTPSSSNYIDHIQAQTPTSTVNNDKDTLPPVSTSDKSEDNIELAEHPCHKITVFPLKGPIKGNNYKHLARNIYNQNCNIRDICGEPGYLPIQDTGVKFVESTPTKLVSLLRPLFELNQERRNALTRKNKGKLKRCVSLGISREPEDKYSCNQKIVTLNTFYELGKHGWMSGKLNGTVALKGTLDLDTEITKLIENYNTSAIISLGNIQITF